MLDGDVGWYEGKPVDDVARWIASGHAFQWMVLEVEDWFTDLQPAGEADFGGVACEAWNGRDFLDGENVLYFEKESGLLKGLDLPNHFDRKGRIQVYFDEWRTVGGIRLPKLVRVTDGQGEFELDFTEITLNDVDVAVFERPGKPE